MTHAEDVVGNWLADRAWRPTRSRAQESPSASLTVKAQTSGPRGPGRSKNSPGVKGLEAGQVHQTRTWVRGSGIKLELRMETTSRDRGC